MRALITLLFFLLWIGSSLAQDHEYIQYTAKDGLPTNYVYGVVEDDDGYIWAYTENGLSKFDGYSFKNYSTKDGMPGNDVPYCWKDDTGKIWLHTYQNKPAYLLKDSFKVMYSQNCSPVFMHDEISYWCQDSREIIYRDSQMEYLTRGQIDSLILAKEAAFFRLDSVRALPANWNKNSALTHKAFNVYITKDSVYYYSQRIISPYEVVGFNFNEGYLYFSWNSNKFYWKNGKQTKSFDAGDIDRRKFKGNPHFYKIPNEEKYLMSNHISDIIFIDIEKESVKRIYIEDEIDFINNYNTAITVTDSNLLIKISQGFLEYSFDGDCTDKMISNSLAENYRLLRSYKDSKGNIWIGSREGGLFFISKQKRKTSLLTSPYSKDKSFEQLINTADGKLLGITDNSGVYHIDDDDIINILPPSKAFRFRSAISTPYGIIMSSSRETYIIKSNENDFTISSFEDTFEDIGYKSPRFNELHNRLSLAYDSEKNTLYAYWVRAVGKHRFLSKSRLSTSLLNFEILILNYDTFRKTIYGGNLTGLFRMEGEEFIPFLQQYEELKSISTLYSTAEKMWIGTESNGLFVYDFQDEVLSKVSEASMIRRIRADTDSTLLVASNEGLLLIKQFEIDESKITYYTTQDGLPINEIQDAYTDGGQFIYIATTEGIHKLDRTIKTKTSISEKDLKITSIHVNKKNRQINQLQNLSHWENTLDIQYNLLSYPSNTKIQYYTKLTPFQTEWNESDSRSVNYLSLPPMGYTFNLKAKDVYGNEISLQPIEIKIREAYWQTLWFKLMITGLAMGILFLILYRRDQVYKNKLEEEKRVNRKMAELELSALRAQMNPHFVFNALGAIQYFIQTNETDAADNYLSRFARLIRKYLDSSKEKMISLKEELELLTIYTDLEQLRFEDLFNVELKVDTDIQPDNIFLPSMLIQPFIENAINHGLNERRDKQGLLQVYFTKENELLVCIISDNGIGRKNAQKNKWEGHQSRGMTIIEEKIATLKSSGIADISINISDLDSSQTTFPGTQVILKINNLEDE